MNSQTARSRSRSLSAAVGVPLPVLAGALGLVGGECSVEQLASPITKPTVTGPPPPLLHSAEERHCPAPVAEGSGMTGYVTCFVSCSTAYTPYDLLIFFYRRIIDSHLFLDGCASVYVFARYIRGSLASPVRSTLRSYHGNTDDSRGRGTRKAIVCPPRNTPFRVAKNL